MPEQRPIPGLSPSLMVDEAGTVTRDGNVITPYQRKTSGHARYLAVTLNPTHDYADHPFKGRRQCYADVHELVLLAFHGLRPIGQVARWRDGDRLNVAAVNLTWGARYERYAKPPLPALAAGAVLTLLSAGLSAEQVVACVPEHPEVTPEQVRRLARAVKTEFDLRDQKDQEVFP